MPGKWATIVPPRSSVVGPLVTRAAGRVRKYPDCSMKNFAEGLRQPYGNTKNAFLLDPAVFVFFVLVVHFVVNA